MRSLLFTLVALISGFASAQHIRGVKTLTINEGLIALRDDAGNVTAWGTSPNNSVIVGIVQKGFLFDNFSINASGTLIYSGASFVGIDIDPLIIADKILEPGKVYKFVIRDGVIVSAELNFTPLVPPPPPPVVEEISKSLSNTTPEGTWYMIDTWYYKHWLDEPDKAVVFEFDYEGIDFENKTLQFAGATFNYSITGNTMAIQEVGSNKAILLING